MKKAFLAVALLGFSQFAAANESDHYLSYFSDTVVDYPQSVALYNEENGYSDETGAGNPELKRYLLETKVYTQGTICSCDWL